MSSQIQADFNQVSDWCILDISKNKSYALNYGHNLIGRSYYAKFVPSTLETSRQHGRIEVKKNKVLYTDISTNGTRINNKLLNYKTVQLKKNDELRIGTILFKLQKIPVIDLIDSD